MPAILAHILITLREFLEGLTGRWNDLTAWAADHLGAAGPWIVWGLAAFVVLFVVSKATRLAFDLLRFVVLPSAAMSIALMLLMPGWPPTKTFPVFLAATTAMMFLRSR